MRYSRTALIALLVAAEIVVAGAAFSILRGHSSWTAGASSFDRTATPQHFPAIDAGAAPNVTASVPDSRVIVEPSTDGQIHVSEETSSFGPIFGRAPHVPPLQVTRTAGGVTIERPATSSSGFFVLFGDLERSIRIAVPPQAAVEIAACSGAQISGIGGQVSVRSKDGSIRLKDLTGDVDVSTLDGRIRASGIRSGRVAMESRDGSLTLEDIAVEQLTATTHDGAVRARGLQISGPHASARVHSDDGSVSLHFADAGNLTVQAQTSDGHIVVDGRSTTNDGDNAQATYTLGSGAGALDVSTQDGTIAMTTNGAQ